MNRILPLLLIFFSCQQKQVETPVLSDEKLARIMADISIADAATTGLSGYAKDSLMQVYFKQVFDIHGVDLETYEKDLRILAKNLDHMEQVVKLADELLLEKK
ncbi:MAG: DUF4296 domain-containing protein [Saprospiraceae bacterium]|nr:DUF4296 domain-containing protein [Saprospiraceae bacterium]